MRLATYTARAACLVIALTALVTIAIAPDPLPWYVAPILGLTSALAARTDQ